MLLAAYGYKEMNLRALCQQAGVSTGAFYTRFAHKKELALYIADLAFEELVEILKKYSCIVSKKPYYLMETTLFSRFIEEEMEEIINRAYSDYEKTVSMIRLDSETKNGIYKEQLGDIIYFRLNESMDNRWTKQDKRIFSRLYISFIFELILTEKDKLCALKKVKPISIFLTAKIKKRS